MFLASHMKAEQTHTPRSRWPVPPLVLPAATRARLTALCLGLALCARASATVIDTYPDWDGNVTEGYLKVAQSFVAPADSTLVKWKFTLAPIAAPTNILFEIVPWNTNSGPSGSALFTRQLSWPTAGGDMLVDNINLTLAPGSIYAALVDLEGYGGKSLNFQFNQNSYNQGNGSWYGGGLNPGWRYLVPTYNTEFRAEFTIPEPPNLCAFGLAATALLVRSYGKLRPNS